MKEIEKVAKDSNKKDVNSGVNTHEEVTIAALSKRLNQLENQLTIALEHIENLKEENKRQKEIIKYLNGRKHLKKSEKIDDSQQQFLFDEMETVATKETEAATENDDVTETQVKSYIRRSAKNKTLKAPEDAPVTDVYHDELEDDNCEDCGSKMKKVGEIIKEVITFVPAHYAIVRHHYSQYKCENCLGDENEISVVNVKSSEIMDGTICDSSLLANIIVSKYQYGLPLYRLEQMLMIDKENNLSRQTISSWVLFSHRKLKGLEKALERDIRKRPYWSTDETGFKVVKTEKNKSNSARNCHMIVRASINEDNSGGPVMYTYTEHKKIEDFERIIGDYSGVIQHDGLYSYASVAKTSDFVSLDCLIHARRKFIDYQDSLATKSKTAKMFIAMYTSIFKTESDLTERLKEQELTLEEFSIQRKEVLTPMLNELKGKLEEYNNPVIKGSRTIYSAIKYSLDRWDSLVRFLDYPFAQSHNMRAERAIKPFTIGRKNFLFSYTSLGAHATAFYYSLVETCKAMGIDTMTYLTYLFKNAGKAETEEDWDALLPQNVKVFETEKYLNQIRKASPDPDRTEPYILRGKTLKNTR